MILVDTALKRSEEEGNPVRVGLVGAGYMGRGIALQILSAVSGMRLVAISNRHPEKAREAYRQAGAESVRTVESTDDLERAIEDEAYAVAEDGRLLCRARGIDAIIEATGDVEFGAAIAVEAIENGKHIVLMNAELDATVGPILKVRADRAGVVMTNTDGDQPGVVMNLLRFVETIGYEPVLAGNIKGLYDPYRTPETQKEFAEAHGQKPRMVTSFADGTKLSMEMAVVANATGFGVGRRGMYGPRCDHVNEAPALFSVDELRGGGIVDYVLGAEPGPGVFVLGYDDDPVKQDYMRYFKMGDGPLYVFYVPYHLPHLEVPISVARAVLFDDPVITPRGAPVCEVITSAKRDLEEGEELDGLGGFTAYGLLEDAEIARTQGLLPIGLAEGARLVRAIPRDRPVRWEDVELPGGRLIDELRAEQDEHFESEGSSAASSAGETGST